MNKKEMVQHIAIATDLNNKKATFALNYMLECIASNLANRNKVSLMGFGTFSTDMRKERKGRNPQTGEAITIPAKTVVKFKASKVLGNKVNNGK